MRWARWDPCDGRTRSTRGRVESRVGDQLWLIRKGEMLTSAQTTSWTMTRVHEQTPTACGQSPERVDLHRRLRCGRGGVEQLFIRTQPGWEREQQAELSSAHIQTTRPTGRVLMPRIFAAALTHPALTRAC